MPTASVGFAARSTASSPVLLWERYAVIRHGRSLTACFLLALGLHLTPQPVHGQQPRSRLLTYDSERKDWVETPPPAPGTAEGDLHAIRTLIKDVEFRKALAAIKKFVKTYGQSHVLYPDALIAKAEALIGRKDYHKAHLTLQEFLNQFAGMGLTSEALRLEFVIAETYLAGAKRKVMGLPLLSGEDLAFGILDEISVDYPEAELAELAIKTKADYLFRKGEHSLAELEYSRLLREFPQSRYHQFCFRRSAEAALASFQGIDYDDTALIEAEERYRDYQRAYPAAAQHEGVDLILDGIREARAEKEFTVGQYYERTDHLRSAVFHYDLIRQRWPDTLAATKATSRLQLIGALRSTEKTAVP
jgi:outer membrane protein assembly factor BamD (BamD/ComL family)